MRVWRGVLATGAWTPVTAEGVGVEAFSPAPVGTLLAVVADRGATSELQLVDGTTKKRRQVSSIGPGVIWNVSWHGSGDTLGDRVRGRADVS